MSMTTDDVDRAPALPRVSTGVPGLDEVTGGGLLKSGVYIVQGSPGAGKTILANQIAHRHAADGGHVVYVTLLAESHGRLLQHMEPFSFFDLAALPERVYYVSAFNALQSGGLPEVVKLLRGEMRAHSAGILVLDGLVMAASAAASDESLKLFVSEVQAHSTLTGCTTLLLTSDSADSPVSPEHTMVDGIMLLRERAYGPYRERNLEVLKFRGSRTLRGNHAFEIGPDGIVVYPRLEAALRQSPTNAVGQVPVSSGVPDIDRLFALGGFAEGAITTLCGPSGSGKTTMALHFMARAGEQDRGVYMGFYESPDFLAQIGRAQGIDPKGTLSSPHVHFLWQPFGDNQLDAMAARLFDALDRTGARRLVIDGLGGFMAAPSFGERRGAFVAALTNELRRRKVTTLVTVEEPEPGLRAPFEMATMSAIADAVVNFRITHEHSVRRFIWIGKSRIGRTDLRIREAVLGPAGLTLIEGPAVAP
jgi:circadian clock protein KaiC